MAKHYVTVEYPEHELGKQDAVFQVYENGDKFGTLRISKGAFEWTPRSDKKPYKLGWKRLDRAIKDFYGHD
jgi:hypothetical protein